MLNHDLRDGVSAGIRQDGHGRSARPEVHAINVMLKCARPRSCASKQLADDVTGVLRHSPLTRY